jgi:glycosyltransferase involved in cell wall biosynthesis
MGNAEPNNPLVSIALATYNGERFLREQLDSLIEQSYRPLEIVVCDDNSRDGTQKLLTEYEREYPELFRVHYNASNIGYIRNFERATRLCKGRFIAFCDQDDVWDPLKIETLVGSIGPYSLIHSDAALIDEAGALLSPSYSSYSRKRVQPIGFIDLLMNNQVTGCTCLFKQDIVNIAGCFPEKLPHDHWIALVAYENGGITYLPRCLTRYRQHSQNQLGAKRPGREISKGKSLTLILQNAGKKYQARKLIYESMREHALEIFNPVDATSFLDLLDYYSSFFKNAIRVKSLLFFVSNLKSFSYSKKFVVVVKELFFSFIGFPILGGSRFE